VKPGIRWPSQLSLLLLQGARIRGDIDLFAEAADATDYCSTGSPAKPTVDHAGSADMAS